MDDFYCEERLDAASWETLAVRFEESGRPVRAEHTRLKLHRLQEWQRMSPEQRRQASRKYAQPLTSKG